MPFFDQMRPFLRSCTICCKKQKSCYSYSSQVTVGPKFRSLQEIKQYIDSPSWSLAEVLTESESSDNLPTEESVKKLLKLSGFSEEKCNIKEIQHRLGKQLVFLQSLQKAPLADETTDTMFARIMPRAPKSLDYKALLNKIQEQKDNKFDDEISGSWSPTSNSKKSKNGYFVVTKKITHTG
ncbi:similar to Saccharomyces cerevisiae YGR102C Subunit of the trimeric GatFAB AmidoTransferase(AdT) complex [Maudiozyma barnettii]|uniref:Glutamyl-tRNA(Gln) amidotransferase subunit F, mitochondrial n=1 Tax=Maudiozyma barnettii TaxID=61262 RepID=A0A8H2ZFK5_9SACH|nr:glutamyl-tRNA(Gln) amidotransferase subunit F [Kazachstania barnettii]CAB4251885.1 similar to Saccharomyces cerevisiae YGR102C Subunit of the trimeric GatFAB AmidoTransferase(AdT) complex [Kazachstania barnettii]CAD1778191.1 similar to Saccharomyces cerevisiae YGR102C Subunit of the trimeric GatFAB AmidoTransferase(AdT) complex [Kazachstania barnettii]